MKIIKQMFQHESTMIDILFEFLKKFYPEIQITTDNEIIIERPIRLDSYVYYIKMRIVDESIHINWHDVNLENIFTCADQPSNLAVVPMADPQMFSKLMNILGKIKSQDKLLSI